jgi:hypothetical protein
MSYARRTGSPRATVRRVAGGAAIAVLMVLLAACTPSGGGSSGNPTLSTTGTNTNESESLS